MRIGEIKNIIGRAMAPDHTILMDSEGIYGGQAFNVNNFVEITDALQVLSNQKWNDSDISQVLAIIDRHLPIQNPLILTSEEFVQINTYLSLLNPKLPLFYSMLESLSEVQNELTINIKLPEGINSFAKLNETNKNLDDVLKLFNVDGKFEFKGFDIGTEWYETIATGIFSYSYLLACLNIVHKVFEIRTEYFKSESARIAYEASVKQQETTEQGFKLYEEEYVSIFINKEINKAIDEIGKNGQTKQELQSHLVNGTNKLIQQLEAGVEFHLSLNPPSFAEENKESILINYKKIREIIPKKSEEVKEIESKNEQKKDIEEKTKGGEKQ